MPYAGWVKLYRSILDSSIFSDSLRLKAWIYILLKVNHKSEKTIINGNYVLVERGQTITSISKLSVDWKCDRRTVKKILEQFQNEHMITYKVCNKQYTTITVEKYGVYQDERTTECTTERTQTRMNKNEKNEKNDKKKEYDASGEAPAHDLKHKYGSYQHVLLKDAELAKLNAEFGESETQAAITYLDEYIEMKGYKAKSHYLAMRKWVFTALNEKRQRDQKAAPKGPGFKQNDYDFEELERRLLAN